jgi:NitT/TauT family transport system substrate-binding protein
MKPRTFPAPRHLWRAALGLALATTLAACNPSAGSAGAAGGSRVTLAIPAPNLIVLLPATLADRLGYYADEGLDVRLEHFQAGSKALHALLGGDAQVVQGFYEHTVHLAARGQSLKSFVTLVRSPGAVLAVSPKTGRAITGVEDLKGAVVGVTAPGSGTHFFANHVLVRHGLAPEDVSIQAIGSASTAIAAMEQGQVDAAVLIEPTVSQLEQRVGPLNILVDTRTQRGADEIFGGGQYPGTVLYARSGWIDGHKATARKLARAMIRTLHWIDDHSAEEIAATMPQEFRGDDPSVYVKAIATAKSTFALDERMSGQEAEAVRRLLALSIPEVRDADIDLAQTYTNEFLPPK